jgi:hypothetical protein
MNNNWIIVDRLLLPEEIEPRADFLKDYFCEMIASSEKVSKGWCIKLNRPLTPDYYVDPLFQDGLSWWSKNFGEVHIEDVPFAFHNQLGFQLSFQDSWTIYSWSKYLSQFTISKTLPKEMIILHLDDHDDFMAPRLLLDDSGEKNSWIDAITKQRVDLFKPETVKVAVESGAIGIGSFFSPLLHLGPRIHVRHLCSTEYLTQRIGAHSIRVETVSDNLLSPGSPRPTIRLVSTGIDVLPELEHTYLVTDNLEECLDNLPDCPILVHVDMDYFNNRYNGDSDWVYNGTKYNPSSEQVLKRIDVFFDALGSHKMVNRIVDFALALSPGFFPVDLWSSSIQRIKSHYEKLFEAKKETDEKVYPKA